MVSRPESDVAEAPRDSPYVACASSSASVLTAAGNFARDFWRRAVLVSAAILVPCFWHREIEADDLGSHLYNAWLVQLIHHGQAHGLWIDHRWNNVLFDYLLSGFGALFGLHTAEKIAVAIGVLIFFWGTFALISAASRRAPWYLIPLLAMGAYGWTFHIGLFNYYLALGLSFFALAIIWRGRNWEWLIVLALAPLIVLAHPLALFWLVGAGLYAVVAERVARGWHFGLLLAGIGALIGIHEYLWAHYVVEARPPRFWQFNGADQFVLFGSRYHIVAYAFLALVVAALGWDLYRRGSQKQPRFWTDYALPLELYALVCGAVLLLPRGAHVPGHIGAVALLTDRLTSVSLALLLCLLGAMHPRRWHLVGALVLAAVFFAFVYRDTARINRMEAQVAKLVRTLPPRQRVMGTILPPRGSRVGVQHILDRACIGYCYSYGNYEPGSRMFRVRAEPSNPYVLANYDIAVETEMGRYRVQPADQPVYQVYQCGQYGAALCIHPLKAGEQNDDWGVHPGRPAQ